MDRAIPTILGLSAWSRSAHSSAASTSVDVHPGAAAKPHRDLLPRSHLGLSCCLSDAQSGTIQSTRSIRDPDEIFQVIVRSVVAVIPDLEDHEFSKTDELEELGLNSIERTDVIVMSLEELNLQIPLVETRGANDIGELAQLFHAKLRG